MTWIEQFNAKVLKALGLDESARGAENSLDFSGVRLEQLAHKANKPSVAGIVPPKRRLPPAMAEGSSLTLPGPSDDPSIGDAAPRTPGGDRPYDHAETGSPSGLSPASADLPGDQPPPPPVSTRGSGSFAVLKPRVQRQKAPRASVRSQPRTASSRSDEAEERTRVRSLRPRSMLLVESRGGFLVPGPPAPLQLPEVPLPPAPGPSQYSAVARAAAARADRDGGGEGPKGTI